MPNISRRYIAICRSTSRASAFTIDRRFLANITSEWSFPRQDTEIQGFPCPRAAILSTHNSAMAAALPKTGRKQDRKIRVDRFVPRTVNASCSFLEPSILADVGSFQEYRRLNKLNFIQGKLVNEEERNCSIEKWSVVFDFDVIEKEDRSKSF